MTSKYILLAKLKARYDLEKDCSLIGEIIKRKYEERRKVKRNLLQVYQYIPEKHKALFSPHSISKNEGCGCVYCSKLHKYASFKLETHRFKRSFYSDFGEDALMMHEDRTINPRYNFYALYSQHTAEAESKDEEVLTQLQFFQKEYAKRKSILKELRKDYKLSQEAIQVMLSA